MKESDDLAAFAAALQKLGEAGRETAEAGREFAESAWTAGFCAWNDFPPNRLHKFLAYTFPGTDGAVCEASRLGFSPDRNCWPATHN
jgi:hypothetical protein